MTWPLLRIGLGLFCLVFLSTMALGCKNLTQSRPATDRTAEDVTALEKDPTISELLPAEDLPETFVLQQTVTVRWASGEGELEEASFDAAVQREGKSLLLLGLGPMGRVGFTLKLEAGAVSFENRTGRELPFEAARMLADVQRVYYPWIEDAPSCRECVRQGNRQGYSIEERWSEGRIVLRRFERSRRGEGPDPERLAHSSGIEIRYSGEPAFGGVLRDARLRHEALGYEVELKTMRINWID